MGAKWGQHFLTDAFWQSRILGSFMAEGQTIVEVGPGAGALTKGLWKMNHPLILIEIDPQWSQHWQKKSQERPNTTVYHGDVLDLSWDAWGSNISIISNLPYQISGPFLIRLTKERHRWRNASLLLQQEVAQKAAAAEKRGRLSVQMQRHCQLELGDEIPPGAFSPPPRVNSQMLHLRPKPIAHRDPEWEMRWDAILQKAFSQKRKMLRSIFPKSDLGSWSTCRPESLNVDAWIQLVDTLGTER